MKLQRKEKLVEVIEIWRPCKKNEQGDGLISYHEKKNYKRVALLVEGHPHYLEQDFVMERNLLSVIDARSKGLFN